VQHWKKKKKKKIVGGVDLEGVATERARGAEGYISIDGRAE
jgi:hypothetical protein